MYQLKPLQTITSLRPRLVKLFHLMHNRGEKILHQWRTPSLANKFIEKKTTDQIYNILFFYKKYYIEKLTNEMNELFNQNIEQFKYVKDELTIKFDDMADLLKLRVNMYRPNGPREDLSILLRTYTDIDFYLYDIRRAILDDFIPQVNETIALPFESPNDAYNLSNNDNGDTYKISQINYLDFTVSEFLDTITNEEIIYDFTLKTDNTSDIFRGTVKQLKKLFEDSNLEADSKGYLLNQISAIKENTFEKELGELEIYNYLEKVTSKFELEKMKILLDEIDIYYDMVFLERINIESVLVFNENGWQIPKLPPAKMKINGKVFDFLPKINNKDINMQMPDYESMRKKTHPFDGFFLYKAISILKSKLEKTSPEIQEKKAGKTLQKTFPEYLLHPQRDILAAKLKDEFKTEKGKGIRLMIEALKRKEPQLLIIENRQRRATYKALKLYFSQHIGSYQSIFDHKNIDEIDLKDITAKLDFILTSINKDR